MPFLPFFTDGDTVATGQDLPGCLIALEVYQPGAEAAEVFQPGQRAVETYQPGAEAVEVKQ